jgi:hypothetical protein
VPVSALSAVSSPAKSSVLFVFLDLLRFGKLSRKGKPHLTELFLLPLSRQHHGDGPHQYLAIQQQVPVPHIAEIEQHARFKRWIRSCCDLPQSSEARLHVVPAMMLGTVFVGVIKRMGPRAD